MSKEKQIEEMTKIGCVGMHEGVCENCSSKGFCSSFSVSRRLYNAGYRKQSYGEWTNDNGRTLYKCSVCGRIRPYDAQADDISYWPCNYCPNCGAKMRKEGEGK